MSRVFPVVYLFAVAFFCSLPYLVGLEAPTLAIPEAEYAALASLGVSVIAYRICRRRVDRLGLLPVYTLGLLAVVLSSLSWFGIPFIDAIFILTGLLAGVGFLALTGIIIARLFRRGSPA